ncbi:hypothetical protein BN6_11630 [Saccharothrix espanaensis DSM 44229]|uniref:Uncharacterized protein n=1 Tax=Saccharothrix espanaensis (strain ATCC 51144 / DSM 44229 / JCM 9112 / NBRC 15066 / NRRL 15764) TaxID=1179773 RepID=K0JUK3_SACES|nr:hypothetical protein BN6_11630 [Saccharothrix espanaensis DSM 44229]
MAGVDVRGAPWGTRELDLLDPSTLVQRVHAVVLADGPASVGGVVRWLAERHFGFPVGRAPHEVVPIVPAAAVGRNPDDLGFSACEAAGPVEPGALVVVGETVAALVVVDAELDKAACRRVAMSAHDGLVRAGLHLPATVFAVATGVPTGTSLNDLCAVAADQVAEGAR